jgi:integrase
MASYRKLPSGRWQAIVKHPSGRRYTRSDPLKRIVVEWATELETQIRRGDFVDPNAGKITLSVWWEKWSELQQVEATTTSKRETLWRLYVQPAFGSWPLASIQSWDVETWVARMAKDQVRPHSAAESVRLLKHMLADAVRHRVIRTNQAELVKTPTTAAHDDRILDDAEIPRLLEAITMPGDRAGVRRGEVRPRVPDVANRVFVELMLFAGLRWEEVAGLHGFRVDLMRRKLHVREVIVRGRKVKPMPKTAAGERDVPIGDDLVAELSQLMAGRPREGLVFTEADGRPLDYSNWLKRVWNRAVLDAGLVEPLPTPHDCRHTYGTMLAEEGVPPHEIMALMGHSSLRAVERYIHARAVRLDRAREALGARRAHGPSRTRRGPASAGSGNGA